MTSKFESDDFTWQSLHEYIERRIAGVLKTLQTLQSIKEDPRFTNADEIYLPSFERELKMLRQCLALTIEMQTRESLQDISPILSLNIIRLRCRHQQAEKDDFVEFAWISPISDGQYSLRRMGINESHESGEPDSFDTDLVQIIEEVEKLVEEICFGENQ